MGAALEQDSNRKTFYIENLIRHKFSTQPENQKQEM